MPNTLRQSGGALDALVARGSRSLLSSGLRRRLIMPVVALGASLQMLFLAGEVAAQVRAPIEYTVSLTAPQTQMVDISVRIADVQGATLDLSLPTWRPGRYVILDPAGTVREVRAHNADTGRELAISKIDKSTWRVRTEGVSVLRIDYRVYANSLRDRTRHVDDTHAFLSGSSVFMYVPLRRGDRVLVHINAPPGWTVATGLERRRPGDPFTFTAPNYDVLVDSPLEIGRHDLLRFNVDGIPHEIAIWGEADYDADQLTEDFGKIVSEEAAVFGNMPYIRYVFLIHAGAGAGGGTEHLNSTIMQTSRRSLEDPGAYKRFLGLVAHEMFHTWNVKQLRPRGIHPYDYQNENYTKLLWVSEGTTSYYTNVILTRAGLMKPKAYFKRLGEGIDRFRRRPGRLVQSLEDSSYDAWIKFNRSNADSINSTVSFYSKGSLVSLLLDMEIRQRSGNATSFDDVLRTMYQRFPLSGNGFTPDDLLTVIEELAGADFGAFFDSFVRGTDELPLASALETAGLELYFKPSKDKKGDDESDADDTENDQDSDDDDDQEESDAESVPAKLISYLGLNLSDRNGRAIVSSVLADGPAYESGLIPDDEVVAMNYRRLRAGDLNERLKKLDPGSDMILHVLRRDRLRIFTVRLAERLDGAWSVRRVKEPTELQRAICESWLGQSWPDGDATEAEEEVK